MKKSGVMKVFSIALLAAIVITGCGSPASQGGSDANEVIELTLGHSGSPTHHYQITSEKFAEIVSEKTGGKIKVNSFPADQLGAGQEQLEAVKVGTQDLAIEPDAFLASHEPLFNALGMPYQFTSFEQVQNLPGSEAAKFLEEKIKDKGMIILGWCANGFRLMTSNTPIATPEDMRGMKMRIGSAKLISDLLTTLGANPTPVSMSETYSALQTGIVDGQENPSANILAHKLYEVQDHLSLTRHQYVFQPLVMNKAKFDSLSPEFQNILLQAGAEVAANDVEMVRNAEASEIAELEKNGMTVTEPDVEAFRAALQPLYENYAAENGAEWEKLIEMIKEVK